MKGRGLYIALIMGILVLIGAAAVLTHLFFNVSIPDAAALPDSASQANSNKPLSSPSVTEVIIDAGGPADRTDITRTTRTTRPSHPPQTRPPIQLPPLRKTPDSSPSTRATARASATKDIPGAGTAVHVTGDVTATDTASRRRILTQDSRILVNDEITTGSASKIRIEFNDNSVLSVGENSSMMIDAFVFDPQNAADNRFHARFTKGACRLVTGLIADASHREVKVRTRMATIGIRGCDLGFTANEEEERIYVFELSGTKTVQVQTSNNGSILMNALSGKRIAIGEDKEKTFDLVESGNMVLVTRGLGASMRPLTIEEQRSLVRKTSHLPPARYNIKQTPGDMIVTLQPQVQPASEKPGTPQ